MTAEMITASGGVLLVLGGGVGFVWRKIEKRFQVIETKLDACEKRDRSSQTRIQRLVVLIYRLTDAIRHRDPENPILKDVGEWLRRAYPLDEAPGDMTAILGKLDEDEA